MRVFRNRTPILSKITVMDKINTPDHNHGEIGVQAPYDAYDTNEHGHPDGKLFEHEHRPPNVYTLSSTNRFHTPALLGMAEMESRARWGETPTSSDNLSVHSARTVSKLKGAGVVSQGAASTAVNSLDRDWARENEDLARRRLGHYEAQKAGLFRGTPTNALGEELDSSHYRRGGQRLRQALRDSRPSNASAQFIHPDQGTLL